MTLLLLALLAILLIPGIINFAMELVVYSFDMGDSTWPLWEALGFQFVALADQNGAVRAAHVRVTSDGAFCQYRDCHGLIRLSGDGTTSDKCWSWRPLSKSTKALIAPEVAAA